jgi:S1-C subfamily serine protease
MRISLRIALYLLLVASLSAADKIDLPTDVRPIDRSQPGVSYADMLSRVTPAVVSVRLALEVGENDLRRLSMTNPINPKLVRHDSVTNKYLVPIALGSGVVIHPSGYILTNHHVVTAQGQVVSKVAMVQFADGRDLRGTILGSDSRTDVAVVKVDAVDLPYLRFGESDQLRVGDNVFAVGNPLDVGLSVTSGIVSGLSRSNLVLSAGRARGPDYQDFIQTSAPINPGNSGGALVDTFGRLVGMNTAVRSDGVGIGYAVPGNLARFVADSLIARGYVVRGYIGIDGEDVAFVEAVRLGAAKGQAARLTEVDEGAPAFKAGLKVGDLVTTVNGYGIAGWNDLRLVISGLKPGTEATFTVLRDNKSQLVRVPILERPRGQ